jgi:hypothetical protein
MGTLSQQDRDAIAACKYRYLRGVDTKDWDLLASTLTPDAVARYGGGVHTVEGRDAIITFLRERLDKDTLHTAHRVNHLRFRLLGAAWYDDVYVRDGDGWRIAETGYTRTYELIEQWPDGATLTASAWQTDGRTTLPY